MNRRRLLAGLFACAATLTAAAPAGAAEIYTPPITSPEFVWPTTPAEWDAGYRGMPTVPRWTSAADATAECPTSGIPGDVTATATPAIDQPAGFVRVQTAGTGGSWRGAALPETASAPFPTMSTPAVFWRRADALTTAVPTTETVACGASPRLTQFTFAARQPAGASVLQRLGPGGGGSPVGFGFDGYNADATSLDSDIGFRVDDAWLYSLILTVRSGSVTVTTAAGQTVTASDGSATLDLGKLAPGELDAHVTATGAGAAWNVELRAFQPGMNDPAWQTFVPFEAGNWVAMARLLDGEPVSLKYNAALDGTIDVLVSSWDGHAVRWLARDTAVAPGPGAIVWDGRDANGQVVADGQYLVLERVRYGSRYGASASVGLRLDTTKPTVEQVVQPKKETSQLAMKPVDKTSGLATVALTLDGKKVTPYKAKGGGLQYRPKKGWKPGRTYKWRAAVTDNAGNALVKTGKFKVAVKKKPKKKKRR